MKKKKPFKDTKVGKFILGLGDSKIARALPELATGDVLGVFKELLRKDDELTPEQRNYALKLIEMDIEDMKGVSERWVADMNSDNKLSKNVRPSMLIYLTVATTALVVLDSSDIAFNVDLAWKDLLKTLLVTVYVAYFGGRSFEKTKRL